MTRRATPTRPKTSCVAGRKRPAKPQDPVEAYARAVVGNQLVTGRLVRLACERHLRDLVDGPARGLRWDRATAQRAIDFFPAVLRHSKGQYAGQPFDLLDWEQFVVGSIFGWKLWLPDKKIEVRRFRTAFVSTARKNGKSTIEAGIGLKALIDENEPGAEIYSAATTRDQARIVFSEAERMRAGSPALRRRIVKTTNNLAVLATASWFRPLSADTSKMDGLNVFVALVDELHEHPDAGVIEKLDTGMGARLQPLMYETTTAGVSRTSVCYLHWDFSMKVLEGVIPAGDRRPMVRLHRDGRRRRRLAGRTGVAQGQPLARLGAANRGPARRGGARPGDAVAAELHPAAAAEPVDPAARALDPDGGLGATGPRRSTREALRGRRCFAGLDLARINDLSSLALLFPPVRTASAGKCCGATGARPTTSKSDRGGTARPTWSGATRAI